MNLVYVCKKVIKFVEHTLFVQKCLGKKWLYSNITILRLTKDSEAKVWCIIGMYIVYQSLLSKITSINNIQSTYWIKLIRPLSLI